MFELAYYDSAVHRFKPLHHKDTPALYVCFSMYSYIFIAIKSLIKIIWNFSNILYMKYSKHIISKL